MIKRRSRPQRREKSPETVSARVSDDEGDEEDKSPPWVSLKCSRSPSADVGQAVGATGSHAVAQDKAGHRRAQAVEW